MKTHRLALHIFRRDLRLADNTALLHALRSAQQVIPCFILDPRQCGRNAYKSTNALQFMRQSLYDLDAQLRQRDGRLYVFSGQAEAVVRQLLDALPIELVTLNRDYTPFARRRDKRIATCVAAHGATFSSHADILLHAPDAVLKADGTPYTVFTPFAKKARQHTVPCPQRNTFRGSYYTQAIPEAGGVEQLASIVPQDSPQLFVQGGRPEALRLLRKLQCLTDYAARRDLPAEDATSHLSAHNKFGTVSIREVYHAIADTLGKDSTLLTELLWRDFFTQIVYHFPHVLGAPFRPQYAALPWRKDRRTFAAWCAGKTGVPLVDAGMRELTKTGYMHNRVRMVTASFLVKDLQIDWRWGERFFARHLVDYDPAVNNGNWQWAASTGCDAQPYFRIFNPWRQQRRFDPEGIYCKRWLPELATATPAELHALETEHPAHLEAYPRPIVEHATAARETKELYAAVRSR